MRFKATDSIPGRISNGKYYYGSLIGGRTQVGQQWRRWTRIVVYDDSHEWMSFNPKIFTMPEDQEVVPAFAYDQESIRVSRLKMLVMRIANGDISSANAVEHCKQLLREI